MAIRIKLHDFYKNGLLFDTEGNVINGAAGAIVTVDESTFRKMKQDVPNPKDIFQVLEQAEEKSAMVQAFGPQFGQALESSGFHAPADLEGLTDEQILEIQGIAGAGLEAIRAVVPAPEEE